MMGARLKKIIGVTLIMTATGCFDSRDGKDSLQGPGTETVGFQGTAVYPDGTPAKNAAVALRSARFLATGFPHAAIDSSWGATTTDSLGRYKLGPVDPGDYAVEIRDSDNQAALVRCKVGPKDQPQIAPRALLLHLASISGVLKHPQGVKVHAVLGVYGLERRVYNDFETGKFQIPDLPEGTYTLRVTALDPVQGGMDIDSVQATAKSNLDLGAIALDTLRENYATWARSMKIHIRTGTAGANVAGTVTDFPLPVRLSSSNFPIDSMAASSGADIRFANAAGAPLAYEIEAWDTARHSASLWVRVDTVRGGDDAQFIRMYWGKPGAENLSFARQVFDTSLGYENVWHLNENPRAGEVLMDATANGNNAISPMPYATDTNTAPNDQGVYFNGSKGQLTTALNAQAPASFTISLWFQAFSDGKLIGFQNTVPGTDPTRFDRHFWVAKNGYLYFGVNSADTSKYSPNQRYVSYQANYSDDWKWHHVAATLSASSPLTLYYDGKWVDTDSATTGAEAYSGYWQMATGTLRDWVPVVNHNFFYGALDEVRIEQTVRSPDWISLSYQTQKMGSTVVVVGPD